MKKINFNQPKYIIPTIAYVGLLLLGWLVIDLFNVEIKDDKPSDLQTTEYLNADLPTANVSADIGSKRKNVRDVYGNINDLSAIQDFVENTDTTIHKKEEFESKYSDEEKRLLEQNKQQQEEIRRLQELNSTLSEGKGSGQDFVLPMSDEERARSLALRRNGLLADLDRDLNNARGGAAGDGGQPMKGDSMQSVISGTVTVDERAVHAPTDDAAEHVVVKKSDGGSEYFNTISENKPTSNLILAIIDEEVKAVDGSRVRLRLLDDIETDGTTLPKGTYLYATMSGFGQKRVKGKVSSVLVGDEIIKINLSLYDVSDGLEGLYVPQSQFRETAKDIGSAAMQNNIQMSNGYGDNSMLQWANQAMQNGIQRVTGAVSKAIKKNRVRLKYGTQVYLVNSSQQKRR